jgi:hypothetical protein
MITLKELNPKNYETTAEVAANLDDLLVRVNKVRKGYGKPMRVSSGLRSQADQQRINPKAPKSKHLTGQAVDIADPKGELKAYIKANPPDDLWFEDFDHTPGWVHMQSVPPKSGKRFFIP